MRAADTDGRLDAMAGPCTALTVPSTTLEFTHAPLADMTMFLVVDIVDATRAYDSLMAAGSFTGGLSFQTGPAGASDLQLRADTLNGSHNQCITVRGARTAGRHVMWGQTTGGLTGTAAGVDTAAAQISGTIVPGDGTENGATLRGATPSSAPVFGCAYVGSLGLAARTRVLGWLTRRFAETLQIGGGGA